MTPAPLERVAPQPRAPSELDRALALLPEDARVDSAVLSSAFLSAPYAWFILDAAGHILVCNRRAERQFFPLGDGDAEALRGAHFAALTAVQTDAVMARLREGVARGLITLVMRCRPGRSKGADTEFRVSLLRAATHGDHLYLLTHDPLNFTTDALVSMNARRIEARDELARLERRYVDLHASLIAMESFAHIASHDLRTPLNALGSLLQLFEDKFGADQSDKAREYLDYMARAVQQMDAMTTDFINHARSVAAKIKAEPIEIGPMIETVLEDLRKVVLEAHAKITMPTTALTVMAEPGLLRVLLANLLLNAVKYAHPDRPPLIVITAEPLPDGGARLRIADNGRGFDRAERNSIFMPFHRLNPDIEGTGIGLATCNEICRRHSWDITADSDGETGSEFVIRIPQTPSGGAAARRSG